MFVAWNMTWTHCESYWDLDFQPSESSGGQPVALEGSVFGVQFWDGTLLTQEFSSAVLGWYFISGFFTCSFGMAPSELNTFHPQVFQLQFCDGAFQLNIFHPHPQIFYLQFWDGTF